MRQRRNPYQPGATPQESRWNPTKGLKARSISTPRGDGTGFQPLDRTRHQSLGRCPRLVWSRPLALFGSCSFHALGRFETRVLPKVKAASSRRSARAATAILRRPSVERNDFAKTGLAPAWSDTSLQKPALPQHGATRVCKNLPRPIVERHEFANIRLAQSWSNTSLQKTSSRHRGATQVCKTPPRSTVEQHGFAKIRLAQSWNNTSLKKSVVEMNSEDHLNLRAAGSQMAARPIISPSLGPRVP